MKQFNIVPILIAVILFAGCLATNANTEADKSIGVKEIYSSINCGSRQQETLSVWINTQNQLNSIWQSLHSIRLGGNSPSAPHVDFTTHNVFLIRMGIQKSGGYSLDLAEEASTVKDKTATIHVSWIQPEEGAFVTQALTSPCLLLKIEKGDYHTIQVKDQFGNIRITSTRP